jgi:alpha-D-ribose 1-methylphosphonate 5-triphosphate synthase subunit PhnG
VQSSGGRRRAEAKNAAVADKRLEEAEQKAEKQRRERVLGKGQARRVARRSKRKSEKKRQPIAIRSAPF